MRLVLGSFTGGPPTTDTPAFGDSTPRATLPHMAGGNYEGEHGLVTFAVFMLTE